jgi:hypothetical protein
MELKMHFLINPDAFFTDSSKDTPFTASAASIAEKISPVPDREVPIL